MSLFRLRNARIREPWMFYGVFFASVALTAFACQLLGILGFEEGIITVSKLICLGAGIHTAIAMESVGTVLNSRFLSPFTEGEFASMRVQLFTGLVCGIIDVFVWIVSFEIILPHLGGGAFIGLIIVGLGFFLPPYT